MVSYIRSDVTPKQPMVTPKVSAQDVERIVSRLSQCPPSKLSNLESRSPSLDRFEQRKKLFVNRALQQDHLGKDSSGILYNLDSVTSTMGNHKVVSSKKKRPKAYRFSQAKRNCIFDTLAQRNFTPAVPLQPYNDKKAW